MTEERYKEVPLDCLHLDPDNPRLRQDIQWATEPESAFLREFARNYNLLELARSIADKGFTPRHAEALLVVRMASPEGARNTGIAAEDAGDATTPAEDAGDATTPAEDAGDGPLRPRMPATRPLRPRMPATRPLRPRMPATCNHPPRTSS